MFEGIAYGNGQFVAVGNSDGTIGLRDGVGTIQTSTDGLNWVLRQSGTPQHTDLRGVAYGNGRFIAVGSGGTILQSGSIIILSITPNAGTGLLSLSLDGPTGLDYTIQTSADLITWHDVTKITNAQSSKVILDGSSRGELAARDKFPLENSCGACFFCHCSFVRPGRPRGSNQG